ncbi:hypothetical protein [Ferrovibrio sp.]|uniref:hypothetical protein n=1 Tax=Ferrovibrio sp. TaxID=1917215 RepID=UPI0035AFAAE5
MTESHAAEKPSAAAPQHRQQAQEQISPPLKWASGLDWPRLLHGFLIALCCLWIVGYFFPPINHDTAVLLYIAKVWLGGGKLYVDAIDMNTPLVFVLHLLPELLSKLTGLQGATLLGACLGRGIAASFIACRRVLSGSLDPDHATSDALLPLLLLFLLIVYPNNAFGQREHIMLVLAMPYLLIASGRAQGEVLSFRLRLLSGLAAGLGFAMKPYFIGIPALVECYVLVRTARRESLRSALNDPAPWAMLAIGVAHALFAVFVTPEYFSIALPIAAEFYSEVSNWSWIDLALNQHVGPPTFALPFLGILAWFVLRSDLARVIWLAGIGGLISAYAQGKGWPYQVLPAQVFTLLLAGVIIAHVMDHQIWPRHIRGRQQDTIAGQNPKSAPRLFAAVLMVLVFYQESLHARPFFKQQEYAASEMPTLLHILKQEAYNGRVLVLSPGIYPHFPLLNYADMRMTMRFESMWVLQGAYAGCDEFAPLYNPPEAMTRAEAFVFRSVAEDFYKKKPSLLIVDKVAGIPRCQGDTFDYLEYFMRNPLFAKRFEDYDLFMDFDRYMIYKRRQHPHKPAG